MLLDKVIIEKAVTVSEVRQLLGVTQSKFCKMVGIPYSTYLRKEYGEFPWKASEIDRIHEVSGIPIYLIDSKIEM